MKLSRLLIAAFFLMGIFASVNLSAQEDREDVVYLKNGNIYRGIIIEQVPGKTLKVETLGGNVFTVDINDITKITKEKKVVIDNGPGEMRHPYPGGDIHGGNGQRYDYHMGPHHSYHRDSFRHFDRSDSTGQQHYGPKSFQYKKKGYFFKAQLQAEMGKGGVRIINGYKFGQFGYLGIGVGADLIGFAPIGHYDFGGRGAPYAGTYLPLFLHYSGDITRKRIAPFYTIEGGYAMRFGGRGSRPFNTTNIFNGNVGGGMMGGLGIGVKFNCKHRVNFNISANADYQNVRYDSFYSIPTSNGLTWRHGNTLSLLTSGLRFGIGF